LAGAKVMTESTAHSVNALRMAGESSVTPSPEYSTVHSPAIACCIDESITKRERVRRAVDLDIILGKNEEERE